MNLVHTPWVVNTILRNEMSTHYDHPQIVNLFKKLQRVGICTLYHLQVFVYLQKLLRHSSTMKTQLTLSMWLCTPMSFDWRLVSTSQSWACFNEVNQDVWVVQDFQGWDWMLMCKICVFTLFPGSLLLPEFYCQPEWGSRGPFQIYSGCNQNGSDLRSRAHLPGE